MVTKDGREVYVVEESMSKDFGAFTWIILMRDSGIVQARTWHRVLAQDIADALNRSLAYTQPATEVSSSTAASPAQK